MATDIRTDQVTLQKNGDLMLEDTEGVKTLIANYDRKTQRLEYISREYAHKLAKKVTAAIGTTEKGMKESGLKIATVGIKGEAADVPIGKVPPRPKRDNIWGDQTPALVEWYFKYYPKEAYLRYGVFLDENGEPVRRKVRRKITELVDDRNGERGLEDQNDGKGAQVGNKRWEKGPIGLVAEIETLDNQIIARRATCMTYAPIEVVGGFDLADDNENENTSEEASNE